MEMCRRYSSDPLSGRLIHQPSNNTNNNNDPGTHPQSPTKSALASSTLADDASMPPIPSPGIVFSTGLQGPVTEYDDGGSECGPMEPFSRPDFIASASIHFGGTGPDFHDGNDQGKSKPTRTTPRSFRRQDGVTVTVCSIANDEEDRPLPAGENPESGVAFNPVIQVYDPQNPKPEVEDDADSGEGGTVYESMMLMHQQNCRDRFPVGPNTPTDTDVDISLLRASANGFSTIPETCLAIIGRRSDNALGLKLNEVHEHDTDEKSPRGGDSNTEARLDIVFQPDSEDEDSEKRSDGGRSNNGLSLDIVFQADSDSDSFCSSSGDEDEDKESEDESEDEDDHDEKPAKADGPNRASFDIVFESDGEEESEDESDNEDDHVEKPTKSGCPDNSFVDIVFESDGEGESEDESGHSDDEYDSDDDTDDDNTICHDNDDDDDNDGDNEESDSDHDEFEVTEEPPPRTVEFFNTRVCGVEDDSSDRDDVKNNDEDSDDDEKETEEMRVSETVNTYFDRTMVLCLRIFPKLVPEDDYQRYAQRAGKIITFDEQEAPVFSQGEHERREAEELQESLFEDIKQHLQQEQVQLKDEIIVCIARELFVPLARQAFDDQSQQQQRQ